MTLLSPSLVRLNLNDNLVNNIGDAGNAWLGELTNLQILDYGFTNFDYAGVPTEIGRLTNLGMWFARFRSSIEYLSHKQVVESGSCLRFFVHTLLWSPHWRTLRKSNSTDGIGDGREHV